MSTMRDLEWKVTLSRYEAYMSILTAAVWWAAMFEAFMMLLSAVAEPEPFAGAFSRIFYIAMYLLLPWIAIGCRYTLQVPKEVNP